MSDETHLYFIPRVVRERGMFQGNPPTVANLRGRLWEKNSEEAPDRVQVIELVQHWCAEYLENVLHRLGICSLYKDRQSSFLCRVSRVGSRKKPCFEAGVPFHREHKSIQRFLLFLAGMHR